MNDQYHTRLLRSQIHLKTPQPYQLVTNHAIMLSRTGSIFEVLIVVARPFARV